MTSQPIGQQSSIRFGEDFELDLSPRRLRRGSHVVKLERIPLEILVLLLERRGDLVTRDEIIARVWGNDVFLDTDNSIRGAIRKIRTALRDDPETPRYVQTITGRGYRFIAPVSVPETRDERRPADAAPLSTEQSLARDPAPTRRGLSSIAPKWLLLGLALAAVFALSILAYRTWRSSRAATPVPSKMVLAVLPFENLSRDPDEDFFTEGLAEDILNQIGKLNPDRLTVISRLSVAKYKDSKLSASEIGKELKADYLVQGSVQRGSNRVRVRIELIHAQDQTDIWTESYDRELKDVLAVQDSIVRSIAGEIHIALSEGERQHLDNARQLDPAVYEAYLKGRYYWNKRTVAGMQKAEQYFQQAIEHDPTYAAAYSGLADCNSGMAWHGYKSPAEALPKSYAAARKALEIEPNSAEAHASLGLAMSHRWDWSGAESEFKRALQLNPQYANAHHWYADYLSMQRRHEEAIAESRRALDLDPLNLMINTWAGLRYYLARDYPRAVEQSRAAVDLDPNFAAAHLQLAESDLQSGLHDDAIAEATKSSDLSGGSPLYTAQIAVALAAAGRSNEALNIAHQLEAMTKTRYVSPYGVAQIYGALKRKEDTFMWLQRAYDDHAVWMGYLAVDPLFGPYRLDPRFADLLRRLNLPATMPN